MSSSAFPAGRRCASPCRDWRNSLRRPSGDVQMKMRCWPDPANVATKGAHRPALRLPRATWWTAKCFMAPSAPQLQDNWYRLITRGLVTACESQDGTVLPYAVAEVALAGADTASGCRLRVPKGRTSDSNRPLCPFMEKEHCKCYKRVRGSRGAWRNGFRARLKAACRGNSNIHY
jgi:hypothetical protein